MSWLIIIGCLLYVINQISNQIARDISTLTHIALKDACDDLVKEGFV